MNYRRAPAYALPAIATLLVSCSQEASEPAGEWRPVGDGRSVVHSSTGEVRVVSSEGSAGNLTPVSTSGPRSRSTSKAAVGGGAKADKPHSGQGIVAGARASVVTIFVRAGSAEGHGSGFLVFDQRTLVTNFHVVDGAKQIRVQFVDETVTDVTSFVGAFPELDLAILRLDKEKTDGTPLSIAEEECEPGRHVFAIGAPHGLQDSVTDGVISAKRRSSETRKSLGLKADPDLRPDLRLLQVSAPISPGNSGGPLIDDNGHVVGVNTFVFRGGGTAQNLNFAVDAREVEDAYRRRHEPRGLSALPISREIAAKQARNQARIGMLKQFVEAHPVLGLFKFVKDCDAQWTAYTARIRRGEAPSNDDVLSIHRLIATLHDGQLAEAKRVLAIGGFSAADIEDKVIGATPDWRNFLKALREFEH
jgi:S1-C subfamily serine protease